MHSANNPRISEQAFQITTVQSKNIQTISEHLKKKNKNIKKQSVTGYSRGRITDNHNFVMLYQSALNLYLGCISLKSMAWPEWLMVCPH